NRQIWTYHYTYTGDVFFPNRADGLYITTSVLLQQQKHGNNYINTMTLQNPKLSQTTRHTKNLLSDDEIGVWEEAIKFEVLENGAIAKVYTNDDHPTDVLNIKKSIAALFQFKLKSQEVEYENMETNPTGTCRMKYRISNQTINKQYGGNTRTKHPLYKYNITKTNDYTDCQDRPVYTFTNVEPVKCNEEKGLQIPKSRMMSSCIVYKRQNGQSFLQSCHTRERHEVNLLGKSDTPFVVITEARIKFVQMDSRIRSYDDFNSKRSLLFSFEGLTKPSVKRLDNDLIEIQGILDSLSRLTNQDRMAYDLTEYEVSKLYMHLVIHLRWKTSPSNFALIYAQYFNDNRYRMWLQNALPFFGTGASGAEIHRRIENGKINAEGALKLLSRLGVVAKPEKELCEHIMKLCESPKMNATVSTTCWLAFGSLVRSYCEDKSVPCPKEFIKILKDKYDENLHSQAGYHMKTIKDNEKLVVALKAIGNAGQIEHLPLALHILTTWNDHNAIMIAAIEAIRRMPLEGSDLSKAQLALLNIFKMKKMCPEIRIVAFGALLKTGPTPSMLIQMTNTIRSEVIPTVKHYVYTYLNSELKANCPAKKSYKASVNLLGRLANVPHEGFDPRYSFSYLHQLDALSPLYKYLINIETVHTPLSAMPRFVKFKNTVRMMGLDVDHMEVKLRQREIVPLIRDLIGPHGSIYEKKSLWDFIRPKRSVDDQGFPEVYRTMQEKISPKTKGDLPFKLTLSSKLFGSEIIYFVLNESNPVIQSLVDDGTIKVDKDWWSNSLTAGMHFNLSAYDLLFNSMLIIPTSTGLPLHLRSNMAGTFAYNCYGELTTSPMLNLLSWNNRPNDISGTYKECYSMSTYSNSRMYWFYRDTRMGYEIHHSTSSRCPVPVEKITFNVQKPWQKVTIRAVMKKEKYVFSKSSMNTTRFARIKGKEDYEEKVNFEIPSKTDGYSPFPGRGPFMGGPNPGQGYPGPKPKPGQSFPGKGLFMGGPNPGQRFPGSKPKPGQSFPGKGLFMGGPNPGQGFPGPKPKPGQGFPGKSLFMGGPAGGNRASLNGYSLWNGSMSVHSTSSYEEKSSNHNAWYEPGKNVITTIEATYENTTKADDKDLSYDMQVHVNGEGKTKIAEYHLELMINRKPSTPARSWYGFSAKGYNVKDGKIIRMGCLRSSIDIPARRLDIGLGWGKNCSQYNINKTIIYNGKINNPKLDVYASWDALPERFEQLTCPKKFLLKKMEELKKLGSNAGMGAHGGMGGGQGGASRGQGGAGASAGQGGASAGQGGASAGQGGASAGQGGASAGQGGVSAGQGGASAGQGGASAGQGGASAGEGGASAGQGGASAGEGGASAGQPGASAGQPGASAGQGGLGLGGIPPFSGGQPSGLGGVPGLDSLPCLKGINISMTIKDGKEFVMTGFPTPASVVVNYTLPYNVTKYIARATDIMTYGIIATCKTYRNTDEIVTFDKRSYTYQQSTGCPHVLAKDCSKKDLFVVFLKKNDKNEKEVTVVVKDKKGRGHVFVIKPDLTVEHDGSVLQLKGNAQHRFAKIPHVCKVSKSMKYLVIRCKVGVTVITSLEKIKVKVSPWYFHYMCGLCGNYDWIPTTRYSLADDFGTRWLVPGKACSSECKVIHSPVVKLKDDKLCVTTSPVTRCAPHCQATKTTTSQLGYHCIDKTSALAKQTQQQMSNSKFDEVIKAFRGRKKTVKEDTTMHVDCQCTCPKL
ncbi:hypothetical protein QZH41_014080, partial [Actinostola sp. cb2023]